MRRWHYYCFNALVVSIQQLNVHKTNQVGNDSFWADIEEEEMMPMEHAEQADTFQNPEPEANQVNLWWFLSLMGTSLLHQKNYLMLKVIPLKVLIKTLKSKPVKSVRTSRIR